MGPSSVGLVRTTMAGLKTWDDREISGAGQCVGVGVVVDVVVVVVLVVGGGHDHGKNRNGQKLPAGRRKPTGFGNCASA